jgi:hypothetical integral membrane protein (TIGR02206 family)
MKNLFAKKYTGKPFRLFSRQHFIALGIVITFNAFLLYFQPQPQILRLFRYGVAIVLIADEAVWHVWHWGIGQWTIRTMLPLHLCSMAGYLSVIMLFTKNYALYEFVYFMGILGTTQALLTPAVGIYGFPHFRCFQTFIWHGAIVTAVIYMTIVEGYRPSWLSMLRVVIEINVYMLFVGFVNALIGSNYMFLAHKPETPSLLDMLGPWPWYILGMEIGGWIFSLLLYLPFVF